MREKQIEISLMRMLGLVSQPKHQGVLFLNKAECKNALVFKCNNMQHKLSKSALKESDQLQCQIKMQKFSKKYIYIYCPFLQVQFMASN